jgi:hypothetical protein
LERRAIREKGVEAFGTKTTGRKRQFCEERGVVERESMQPIVRNMDAALEFELLEKWEEDGNAREGSIVYAEELAGALERQNGDGVEAREQGRQAWRQLGTSKQDKAVS